MPVPRKKRNCDRSGDSHLILDLYCGICPSQKAMSLRERPHLMDELDDDGFFNRFPDFSSIDFPLLFWSGLKMVSIWSVGVSIIQEN